MEQYDPDFFHQSWNCDGIRTSGQVLMYTDSMPKFNPHKYCRLFLSIVSFVTQFTHFKISLLLAVKTVIESGFLCIPSLWAKFFLVVLEKNEQIIEWRPLKELSKPTVPTSRSPRLQYED